MSYEAISLERGQTIRLQLPDGGEVVVMVGETVTIDLSQYPGPVATIIAGAITVEGVGRQPVVARGQKADSPSGAYARGELVRAWPESKPN